MLVHKRSTQGVLCGCLVLPSGWGRRAFAQSQPPAGRRLRAARCAALPPPQHAHVLEGEKEKILDAIYFDNFR